MNWFEVDKEGLARLLKKRGKEFALFEVISNAWDTEADTVTVTFEPVSGAPKARLIVEDNDPYGFSNLSHAFTLFADSEKKSKLDKRGRFNLGEKLVLAISESATISSTKGTIVFDHNGRHTSKVSTPKGSRIEMLLRMTRAEYDEALPKLQSLIAPLRYPAFEPAAVVTTTINGEPLPVRPLFASFSASLPTEHADDEGNLKRARATTTVEVYEPLPGEKASLYELGIPVCETGDRWHLNVLQKVPLNMERDNVPAGFLTELRAAVVNKLHDKLTEQDATASWVRDATDSTHVSDEAMQTSLTLRFGEKFVSYDPSDPEANKLAVSKGFTLVHGGMLSATEWANAKSAGAILPAGKVTPSPKPYSEDGVPLNVIENLTPAMKALASLVKKLGVRILKRDVVVVFANNMAWPYAATYGNGRLVFNLGRLGLKWPETASRADHLQLITHEFGHEYASDHLSAEYHGALCRIAARLVDVALEEPTLFGGSQ